MLSRLRRFLVKHSVLEILWLGSPVAIWFAYQPLIRFGQDGTMNYELSVAMLYVLVMALAGLPMTWRQRKRLVRMKAVWLVGAFVVLSVLSLLWTMNLTRGVLTVGVTGLLCLVFLGAMADQNRLKKLTPKIVKVYLWSAVAMCGLAVLQFAVGLWSSSSATLLCAGCVAEQFGFVRPNVFLIEPQFLGSALLPAGLVLTHRVLVEKRDWKNCLGLLIVVITLVLTLSRGALLAFAVGEMILVVLNWRLVRRLAIVVGISVAGLVVALAMQGSAVAVNPRVDESFVGGVTKSIHQLTMGVVDLRPVAPADEVVGVPEEVELVEEPGASESNFDGYVEESTNARTTRSSLALRRWGVDLPTVLFGVGVGSAGMAIHQAFPEELGAREIVQNEYIEVLLERGAIGLASFLAILVGLLMVSREQRWLWAVIAAFMVQWNFFSGYPNALHIYLTLVVIALVPLGRVKSEKSP